MNEQRAELHLHTKMSDDISIIGVREMLKNAKDYGLSAIAFTNLNNVQDFPEIAHYAKEVEVKIIYGAEVLCRDEQRKQNYRVTLLAKNQDGVKELYRVISSLKGDKRHQYADWSVLMQNRKNLLVGTNEWAVTSECDYIELYPAVDTQGEEQNKRLYEYGNENAIPVVAVSNAHYFCKEDAFCRDMICDELYEKQKKSQNLYLRTTEEMLETFSYLGEEEAEDVVIYNSQVIASLFEDVEPIKKEYCSYRIENADNKLKDLCYTKAHEIYGKPLPNAVDERLQTEINLIRNGGYVSNYLVAHKIAKYITGSGHMVGTRGLAGSSFVSFLLEITEINPLFPHYYCARCHHFEQSTLAADGFDLPEKQCPTCGNVLTKAGHNIPYESLMGVDGTRTPDFSINVSGEMQNHLLEHIYDMFPGVKIVKAGTTAVLKEKRAKSIIEYYEKEMNISFSTEEKEKLSKMIQGVKFGEWVHQAAVLFVPEDMEVEDFTPVRMDEDGRKVTHFHFYDLTNSIMKVNILAHTTLSILEEMQKRTGVKMGEINLQDIEDLVGFLEKVDTDGLREYDSAFMWDLLERTQPKTFSDIVKVNGFAHGTMTWTENGEELIENGVAFADIPALRDDIMNDLLRVGVERKIAFKFSDRVRKGLLAHGRVGEEELLLYKEVTKPLGDWYFDCCRKVRYMFPKAHAVSYVYNDIRCAWFKTNFLFEYSETCVEQA